MPRRRSGGDGETEAVAAAGEQAVGEGVGEFDVVQRRAGAFLDVEERGEQFRGQAGPVGHPGHARRQRPRGRRR